MTGTSRWTATAAACLILGALPAGAAARATVAAPVAGSFQTNGDLISGWYWLRSRGHTATWTFDAAPLRAARSGSLHLNMSALVTQRASGGSGYSATVRAAVAGVAAAPTLRVFVSVRLVNPFRPVDPAFSDGVGYAAYGSAATPIPARLVATADQVRVTIGVTSGRHVAVKADTPTIGFSVP